MDRVKLLIASKFPEPVLRMVQVLIRMGTESQLLLVSVHLQQNESRPFLLQVLMPSQNHLLAPLVRVERLAMVGSPFKADGLTWMKWRNPTKPLVCHHRLHQARYRLLEEMTPCQRRVMKSTNCKDCR